MKAHMITKRNTQLAKDFLHLENSLEITCIGKG